MNSRIIKKGLKNLSASLLVALTLTSCASTNSREIAQQKDDDNSLKNDVSKIENGSVSPHRFHSSRFEKYNEY